MSALPSRPLAAILLMSVALIAAACGGATAMVDPARGPSAAPIGQPSAGASADPSVVPAESPGTPMPTPTPSASSGSTGSSSVDKPVAPAPPLPTVWSKARVVMSGSCFNPTATVDARGTYHIVAGCGMNVRYAMSNDGRSWKTTQFPHPPHRSETEPQIAVDGSTLYVAYTRQRQADGGCGNDGLVDVGVYYRTRALPDGRWSAPTRIGAAGAHLQSFRVVDGVIHETFSTQNREGPVWYGSLLRGTFRSLRIPGAIGTSLRVGDDGRARIAYTTGHSIRYAVVRGGTLSAQTVFQSRVMWLETPSLVLGAGDHGYMAWAVHPEWGGGCAEADVPDVKPGTYFGTDATGTWRVKRLTAMVTSPSLALDAATSRLHVALNTTRDIRELTRRPDGTWTTARPIAGTRGGEAGVLRRDPVTGHLLLVASRWLEGGDKTEILAFLKS